MCLATVGYRRNGQYRTDAMVNTAFATTARTVSPAHAQINRLPHNSPLTQSLRRIGAGHPLIPVIKLDREIYAGRASDVVGRNWTVSMTGMSSAWLEYGGMWRRGGMGGTSQAFDDEMWPARCRHTGEMACLV